MNSPTVTESGGSVRVNEWVSGLELAKALTREDSTDQTGAWVPREEGRTPCCEVVTLFRACSQFVGSSRKFARTVNNQHTMEGENLEEPNKERMIGSDLSPDGWTVKGVRSKQKQKTNCGALNLAC